MSRSTERVGRQARRSAPDHRERPLEIYPASDERRRGFIRATTGTDRDVSAVAGAQDVIVLLLASDISQTMLVDLALQYGVTRVLDLHSRLSVPPLLATITHRPPRALVGPMLRRELLDAPDQAVLLVLIAPDQLETIRSTITAVRPAAALEILNHQASVDQIN